MLIHLYRWPSVHGPGLKASPMRSRRYTGMMYARYRPTVQIAVIAKYAHGTPVLVPHSAGMVMISAAIETAITALNGTRRWLTRRNIPHPGIARSRENAYQVRDALV